MKRITVLLPTALVPYDYQTDLDVHFTDVVEVPFGRDVRQGVVWNTPPDETIPEQKIKTVLTKESWGLPEKLCRFIEWVADYTLAPVGAVLKMALISDLKQGDKGIFPKPNPDFSQRDFSPEQQGAVHTLTTLPKGFQTVLLDGITGSGKTEVYFEAIAKVLRTGGQALVLLPEIALTTAGLHRFKERFGVLPAVWHSGLTPKKRRQTWQGVLNGDISVVVGARSALFLPFQNLKLIVVDEEHDGAFKQEDGVLYNARDMAVVRGKIEGCSVILSSATPSVETYCNATGGKYRHVELTRRFQAASLPDVQIADMRYKGTKDQHIISEDLKKALEETLERGEQALLFINRRGYAPIVLCHACGEKIKCPHCSVYLTAHKQKGKMMCHYCGYTRPIPPKCPHCGEEQTLIPYGFGSERVAEEVQKLFPEARVELVNSDTMTTGKMFQDFAEKMRAGEVDIVIGTQLLAKGHHFPNLTLVGVIDADMTLQSGDLRASERTFQMLHQVMGRSGRGEKTGRAILQTYTPENLVIQALKENDRTHFLQTEVQTRKMLNMPPFGKLAGILVSGKSEAKTAEVARALVACAPMVKEVEVLGPTPAPLSRLKNKYRWRILVKSPRNAPLQPLIKKWLGQIKIPSSIQVKVDIDPYNFS